MKGDTSMIRKSAKHKLLRRRYKHYAAALAGAAIMAGSLHGIPFAKAAAAETPATSAATEQTAPLHKKPITETDTTVTDPAKTPDQGDATNKNTVTTPDQQNKNKDDRHTDQDRRDKQDKQDRHDKMDRRDARYDHDRYQHERWADRRQSFRQRMAWYNASQNKIEIPNTAANPVDIVMSAANDLGFDVNSDTFTLLSQSGSQSIVRVVHNGTNYDITVNQSPNGNVIISSVAQTS
jgi:hypothetical protein